MTRTEQLGRSEAGFSLVETLIAMTVLATGLLSLAGVFVMGLGHLAGSTASLIAREKAREAVESVHTARDTRTIRWCQIRNSNVPTACADLAPGKFLPDALPLKTAGPDGLVNTADDGALEAAIGPGPDNILGNADDTSVPLSNYTRQIEITDLLLPNGQVNPNLRKLKVIIGFKVGTLQRYYTLTTYISSIS